MDQEKNLIFKESLPPIERFNQEVDKIFKLDWNGRKLEEDPNPRIPLIAVVLPAVERFYGRNIHASNFNELTESKPLKGLDVLEFGYSEGKTQIPNPFEHLLELGAKVASVDPNREAVERMKQKLQNENVTDESGKPLAPVEDVKEGLAQDIPNLFPNREFDFIISSRVMEDYPLTGNVENPSELERGEKQGEEILKNSFQNLKHGGLHVHVTTQPFILPEKELVKLGYEVIVFNQMFKDFGEERKEDRTTHEGRYYTILRKSEALNDI